ncbi:hypothetical protein GCM10022224_007680 [Nonomuraea antimicrobica]|uniref:Uncharacterized protein n=1 Tax=Nonomuraea antimicrobica TaxID=561173 RepID=A0ABP7B2U1_9ACTN
MSVSRIAERAVQWVMAGAGIAISLAGLLGLLDSVSLGGALPKITLLILSTVVVYLLLELGRLRVVDQIHDVVRRLDTDAIVRDRLNGHYGGVARVHPGFPGEVFARLLDSAHREVAILQTWIPNLEDFQKRLEEAILRRRVRVRVLLLHPASPVALLRDEALGKHREPSAEANVRESVESCLAAFSAMHARLGEHAGLLEVHVYNSLPSIAVHQVDEHYLVSSFLHGKLAIKSSQIEVSGSGTVVGRDVRHELDKIWEISRPVDLRDWQVSVNSICL